MRRETALAIFGRNKAGAGEDANGEAQDNGAPLSGFQPAPDKARVWFDRARTVHETGNFDYAMTCWLSGLRLDPTNLTALEGYAKSAAQFVSDGKNKPSKDQLRSFSEKGDVEKYCYALLQWGVKPLDATAAVKAAVLSARVGENPGVDMGEVTYWIGARALELIRRSQPKSNKLYVQLMDACERAGAWQLAVVAGDEAVKLNPSDAELANRTRNLAAQATMSTGGYEQTGQSGGFRANIRDADKQRRLDEQERLVRTEDVKDRAVIEAEEEHRKRPDDLPTINAYVKALLDRGKPEDEKLAYNLLKRAFEATKQFHFRQKAGEITLRWARRKLGEYRRAAEDNAADASAQENFRKAQRKFLEMELEEFRARVEAYPTDVSLKFELGKRELELGNHEEAIALFQESQGDPKLRSESLGMLGQAFFASDWLDEAIDTYRRALASHGSDADRVGMDLRYGLMIALQRKAEQERSLEAAADAEKLASSIAIQQIGYRDIKDRRNQLKELVAQLRQAG
ncbi:MAG: hypothetical protein H6811_11630 [Phycisphaeraceae bacterium]|nr:hypothetical protein [Phycisphaeraceae bacterium]